MLQDIKVLKCIQHTHKFWKHNILLHIKSESIVFQLYLLGCQVSDLIGCFGLVGFCVCVTDGSGCCCTLGTDP